MSLKYIARIVAWLRSEYTLLLMVCISVCNDIATVEELRVQWHMAFLTTPANTKIY